MKKFTILLQLFFLFWGCFGSDPHLLFCTIHCERISIFDCNWGAYFLLPGGAFTIL